MNILSSADTSAEAESGGGESNHRLHVLSLGGWNRPVSTSTEAVRVRLKIPQDKDLFPTTSLQHRNGVKPEISNFHRRVQTQARPRKQTLFPVLAPNAEVYSRFLASSS